MRPSDTPTDSSVVEVTFSTTDTSHPFVGVSRAEQCELRLQKLLPRANGQFAEFFTVIGTDVHRVVEHVPDDDGIETRPLLSDDNGGLVEFVVSEGCPARYLAVLGANPREVVGRNGEGRIVVEIPTTSDAVEITDAFLDRYPTADLDAKRRLERETALFTAREFERLIDERLTTRQREVLSLAYESGYYERPRETTGVELAADLDITPSTFGQHIRAAERNLLSVLYDAE